MPISIQAESSTHICIDSWVWIMDSFPSFACLIFIFFSSLSPLLLPLLLIFLFLLFRYCSYERNVCSGEKMKWIGNIGMRKEAITIHHGPCAMYWYECTYVSQNFIAIMQLRVFRKCRNGKIRHQTNRKNWKWKRLTLLDAHSLCISG